MVYFRIIREGSENIPYCQSFSLPFKGWFTFFQVLIALTLVTSTIVYYFQSFNINNLESYPSLLFLLLILSLLLQIPVVMSTYYRAEDCGFFMPCFWLNYTRWFKHTNSYTDLIQERILAKYGDRLKE